jgi:hypothetical protein
VAALVAALGRARAAARARPVAGDRVKPRCIKGVPTNIRYTEDVSPETFAYPA